MNLGGYNPSEFTELHKNVLIISPDEAAAKAKAKTQINHWQKPHRDRLFEIEKTLDIGAQLQRQGYYLSLRPATQEKPFQFECDYRPTSASHSDWPREVRRHRLSRAATAPTTPPGKNSSAPP